ncbi:MAG: transcription factor S [Thermoplasmata archaeon]|nr:MAG: transcription factor S [Thermoplasmata archaeon]
MSMFCPKCKALMFPKEGMLFCRKCDLETKPTKDAEYTIKESIQEREIKVINEDLDTMPTTKTTCPKCSHNEASFVIRQMRAADEPPTTIYRCIKCRHTWREQ